MRFRRPADNPLAAQHAKIMIFWGFLLLAVLYFFNVILGPYAMVRLHDTFDTDFPHYVIQGKLLLKYGLFGWYPDWAGGMPSFISMHQPYFPLSLVSAFVPLWLTYSLLCVGFMTLAGYGMFRMLQMLFQMDRRIALWGGILFAFANWAFKGMVINEVFNFLFPLFVVWSIELCQYSLNTLQKGWRVLGLLAISLLSYSVITLPFFPIIHLALVLAYGQPKEDIKRLALQTILIWTGYVLIFIPYFYALLDYIPFAHRTYDYIYNGLFHSASKFFYLFSYIITTNPAAPLFICGLPLLRFSRNYRLITVFILLSAVIYAFFGSPFRIFLANTFILKMDPENFFLVLNVLLPISAALFVSETLANRRGRPSHLACVIALAASFLQPNPLVGISALVTGLTLLGIIRVSNSPENKPRNVRSLRLSYMAFVIALVILAMGAKQTDIPFSQPYARLYHNYPELNLVAKEGSEEVFRVGTVDVFPGVTQSYGLETVGQRGPLFNKYYKQLIKTIIMPQLKDPADEKFFDQHWTELYLTTEGSRVHPPDQRPAASWNLPLLLMMNVRYLVARQPIVGLEAFTDWQEKIDGSGLPFKFLKNTKADNFFKNPLYLYRFKETFPRGYLVSTPVILHDHQEVMQQLAKQNTTDLRAKVFFASSDLRRVPWPESPPHPTSISDKNPNLVQYSPDRLVFRGNLDSPGFLVITNNYDPHWYAWVNGRPAPLYRANIAFQTVFIDRPGQFEVVLEYHFPIVWWLHLVCLLGVALFIASAWLPGGPRASYNNKIIPAHGIILENPPKNLGKQSPALGNYRLLGWLAGVMGTLLYTAYLFVVLLVPFGSSHSSSLAASLGRHIYQLVVVPVVGFLLSTWIVIMEKYWHILSESVHHVDLEVHHIPPVGKNPPSTLPR